MDDRARREPGEDGALDFLSPEFSPQKALLFSPSKLQLPCPRVEPCDNLDSYLSVVKGTTRPPAGPEPDGAAGQTEAEPGKKEGRVEPVRRQRRVIKSVLTTMESM